MPTAYDVKTSLVNEGTRTIERLMIKITRLSGEYGEEFIKTMPFLYHSKNFKALSAMEDELPPFKKKSFLGIGFNSYHYINYIRFYSTYKTFPLEKGDTIVFKFENQQLTFKFDPCYKNIGYMNTNICPISDAQLQFLAENKLQSWQLHNYNTNLTIVGGFEAQRELHKQYYSEHGGQELFKKMAQEMLASKNLLFKSMWG